MSKVLMLTYSWSGTTARLAELIEPIIGAQTVKVTVAEGTFSNDMYATSDVAKQQLASGQLPALTNDLPNLSQVSILLIGGPVWNGQVATPIRSLLTKLTDYQGVIAPFYTSAGSASEYEADFKQQLAGKRVAKGLSLTASDLDSATSQITDWWQQVQAFAK